jgi:hypothetical protein
MDSEFPSIYYLDCTRVIVGYSNFTLLSIQHDGNTVKLANSKDQTLMQVFSDHPVMAPEEYCSIYSAENYTQQVFVICFLFEKYRSILFRLIFFRERIVC